MQTEILDSVDQWQALEPEWRSLLEQCGSDSPFMTWEWLEPWRAAFADERPLRVIVVRDAGEAVAILPLVGYPYHRRKVVTRTFRPLGAGLSDRLEVLVHPRAEGAAETLVAAMRSLQGEWDRLELPDLDSRSGAGERLLHRCANSGLPARLEDTSRCPCVPLGRDWESFYNEHVSKRSRTKDRSKLRKFQAMDGFRFHTAVEPGECRQLLEQIFALREPDSYQGEPRRRPFDSERSREFFRDTVERLAGQGWILINVMEAENRLIAYEFGFLYHNRYLDYYGGYLPALKKLSPGRAVWLNLIQRLCQRGVSELDFLRGAEGWKSTWATTHRQNQRLTVLNPALGSRMRRLVQGRGSVA